MKPFIIKPGETVVGVGINFFARMADGETITTSEVTADTGLTVDITSNQGSIALATISVDPNQPDAALNVNFTITGTAGSIRKASRLIWVRSELE